MSSSHQSRPITWFSALLLTMISVAAPLSAQEGGMRARYERAAEIQAAEHDRWVLNQRLLPHWIDGYRFWYKREIRDGYVYSLVDAQIGEIANLFDHGVLAQALAASLENDTVGVDPNELPLQTLRVRGEPLIAEFSALGQNWRYTIAQDHLEVIKNSPNYELLLSPDEKKGAFIRGYNLWLRDIVTGEESPLTTDGEQFYAYGVSPDAKGRFETDAGRSSMVPEAIWSPDSKRIITAQVDDRQVLELPIISFAPPDGSIRPLAFSVKVALPGDKHITQFRMVSIDVETKKQVPAHYPTLPAVRMNDTPLGGNRSWWHKDGRRAYFVEIQRGEQLVRVVEFDTETGSTRVLFEETSDTYIDLAPNVYGPTSIVPLPETNELIWYSERSGWAHLFLYDLNDGRLIRPITQGDWLVRDVIGVDRERREVYITLAGRTAGKDPYYREVARVGLDTGNLTILSESDADHLVYTQNDFGLTVFQAFGEDISSISGLAPSSNYFVETQQRPDRPARTVLRNRQGEEIMIVEAADTSGLPEWWRWPEPVQLKAADGETDISGVVFWPSDYSAEESYPIIDHIYGGPQVSNVPEGLTDSSFGVAASLAELGFVVVVIDGRGTAERDRAFHHFSFGAAHTASNVEDHIVGIRQLAEQYPSIDTTRVGIYGFSGGGYMTANAMLRFPNFFDVGVSASGNHDQRLFWHSWGERYQGLLEDENYLNQANITYAKNLKGKLLFIHGLMDHGVHPGGLFQLTQALMNENKDFDLVLLPQNAHELPGYATRQMWDYFVRHLRGSEPPANFSFKSSSDLIMERILGNR